MARHLSSRNCEAIVDIIDGWPAETKLTWQRLIDQIGNRLGIHPTRQTLNRHADIKHAYQCRKNNTPQVQLSPSERILREQVEQLTAKNSRFSAQVNLFRQMFALWQYNAHKRGVTHEMLSEPLPRIDRDRSD